MSVLIKINNLQKLIPVRRTLFSKQPQDFVHAVDGVDLDIFKNETLSLVGESGCGKSTLGKMLLCLIPPTGGSFTFCNKDLTKLNKNELHKTRQHMQIVFQDIGASLNPRKTVEQILIQPLRNYHPEMDALELRTRIKELLVTVGLNPPDSYIHRYPHEFSGGQRQRIGIARAIVLSPKFIVADEPVSSLDVSVRGQILNLFEELKEKFNLTYLFITHDLSVVRSIADRIAVMYLGKIVEISPAEEFFADPKHPYSKALLSSTPIADPKLSRSREIIELKGELPSPMRIPSGCRFHTRCPNTKDVCLKLVPQMVELSNGHYVACHLYGEQYL